MNASGGAPSNENRKPFAGRSGSVAVTVNDSSVPSLTVRSPTALNTGGTLTSLTLTVIVSRCSNTGEPSSVTTTSKVYEPGPWASVGVHEKTPDTGSIAAPTGAPSNENTNAFAGTSESVADAVNDNSDNSFTV